MTSKPAINKTQSSAGRLKGDECERDWIWDREVETAAEAGTIAGNKFTPKGSTKAEPMAKVAGVTRGPGKGHFGATQGI